MKQIKMNMGQDNRYRDMSDMELCETLKDYALNRSGEIAKLTYAAALRIAVLSAGMEDDGK